MTRKLDSIWFVIPEALKKGLEEGLHQEQLLPGRWNSLPGNPTTAGSSKRRRRWAPRPTYASSSPAISSTPRRCLTLATLLYSSLTALDFVDHRKEKQWRQWGGKKLWRSSIRAQEQGQKALCQTALCQGAVIQDQEEGTKEAGWGFEPLIALFWTNSDQ